LPPLGRRDDFNHFHSLGRGPGGISRKNAAMKRPRSPPIPPLPPEDPEARPISPVRQAEDTTEASLRPQTLAEFVGQKASRENLGIFIQAARARGEALDHVLLHGPPGLGKTTLAQIVARELGVGFRATSGPVIQRAGDLAAILTNLQPRDVLFIDEIHRLQPVIEEVLYPAMEDFQLDLIIGEGPGARSVRIDLPPFTLVGATTRAGLLATPLRDRFGIPLRLVFYTPEELQLIVSSGARKLGFQLTEEGASEIAKRSRGTPRIAGRLLRRVRDFALVAGDAPVDRPIADAALTRLEVDRLGLDAMDRRYLRRIAEHHAGGPVGVETLAAALAEARDTLEDVVEPFLIQEGLILRTSRGRMLGEPGWRHLDLKPPRSSAPLLDLLRDEEAPALGDRELSARETDDRETGAGEIGAREIGE
jgi:Holliday junction DNA helicase RuvB